MNKSLYFYDPNHGNCLRIVNKVDKDTYIINGAYGSDEGKKGYWAAIAKKIKKTYYNGKKYNLKYMVTTVCLILWYVINHNQMFQNYN